MCRFAVRCVGSDVTEMLVTCARGISPRMLESLILHHHANGFEKVVIYFDSPEAAGEQEARRP